jgi:MEMO1 family protein
MKNWKFASAILIIMFVMAEAVFFFQEDNEKIFKAQKDSKENQSEIESYHSALHLDKSFYGNLDDVESGQLEAGKVYGGITSHHFFVAKKINDFFYSLKKQNPKTIVIIGPNHYNVGKSDVLISREPYKTPWGWLNPDGDVIEKLIGAKVATNDEGPFSREHSISALVGFMKYHLPDAKIVPIILKRNANQSEVRNLAEKLDGILPNDSIVVASVDFSHHLSGLASKYHDEKSISVISSFDFERIFGSEIDSPGSVYALERYLELKHAQKMSYENTNSAEFSGNPNQSDVTSYVFSKFYSGNPENSKNISILNLGNMKIEKNFLSGETTTENVFEKIAGPEGNFFKGTDLTFADFQYENILKMGLNDYFRKYKIELLGEIIGHEKYISREISGKKIAFFYVNEREMINSLAYLSDLVRKEKSENNYLIFYIDWSGSTNSEDLESKRGMARIIIDNGADIIFGNGATEIPHVEIYNGKVIFYPSSNIVNERKSGIITGMVFDGDKEKFYLFPYEFQDGQLAFLSYEQSQSFCENYLVNEQGKIPCFFEK